MTKRLNYFQSFKSNSTLIYCTQILIVLSGTTLGLLFLGYESLIVPVTLGAIATALTDFDDRLSIRLRNLGYVCVLFFGVSSILALLHPYKLLFILYLSLSSAGFILLGALGQRYATISFGTVLLSIYTMFGLNDYAEWYMQPSYFVMGTLWYGLSSIIFYLLKPTQAVQDNLAQSFQHLAGVFMTKAHLFDPDNTDHVEQRLYDLSLQSSQVVQSLNNSKRSLLTRLKASRANKDTIEWLNYYFLAQDMHEQATSNYLHYEHIHRQFSRTDLIFRIQKNVRLLAVACEQLAQCILHHQPYQRQAEHEYALEQLECSMQDWIAAHPSNLEVKNLNLILKNLKSIHEQFNRLDPQQHPHPLPNQLSNLLPNQLPNEGLEPSIGTQASNGLGHNQQQLNQTNAVANHNLLDDDIQGFTDLWLKLKQHLSPQSALFRHAVRIGFVFAVGYAISLLPFAKHGYWILLTSLFVCQISYFATKSRLKLRTLGTLLGVILGIPVLYFVPSIEGQLLLTIIFGVSFFYLRSKKYAMATLMATLMVLLIFNLKGAGYSIILPRIIDTVLGCGIAWFAVSFIWPDWNFRNISNNIKQGLQNTLNYFDVVVTQYQQGKDNSIEYRQARRFAHNAQIELSAMISSLSTEPNPNPDLIQTAFRYLVYSHSQLSYVSALGSHRERMDDPQVLALMQWCQQLLHTVLLEQKTLDQAQVQAKLSEIQQLSAADELSDNLALVLKQISLLLETLPELVTLKNHLLVLEIQ
ncbi:putative membrane protein (TIGR01666 family) [Acinetobacter calcoaceticus]|uniref:Putative membrane protein (TIGR01666 family) n=1 Tax=Acinetobacter calcoaceticus TaxID=471 RepID=A0A4R1Y942_ACICA|nr:putative membrane protein (TIGR01666 family) [Acinetobacter calcoaceticus]